MLALRGEDALTVFAPIDKTPAALADGTVDTLPVAENRYRLVDRASYKVCDSAVLFGNLTVGTEATADLGASDAAIRAIHSVPMPMPMRRVERL